jgi:hypothetical protein
MELNFELQQLQWMSLLYLACQMVLYRVEMYSACPMVILLTTIILKLLRAVTDGVAVVMSDGVVSDGVEVGTSEGSSDVADGVVLCVSDGDFVGNWVVVGIELGKSLGKALGREIVGRTLCT